MSQQKLQQRIQEREKELKELQQAVESLKVSFIDQGPVKKKKIWIIIWILYCYYLFFDSMIRSLPVFWASFLDWLWYYFYAVIGTQRWVN
jgi:hypothetical protein